MPTRAHAGLVETERKVNSSNHRRIVRQLVLATSAVQSACMCTFVSRSIARKMDL